MLRKCLLNKEIDGGGGREGGEEQVRKKEGAAVEIHDL